MMQRRTILAAAACLVGRAATAQSPGFPDRPIRLIAGAPPGGGGDLVARLVAPSLAARLGRPVVVDNRPGANGILATEQMVRAPADGHTLLLAFTAHVINPGLMRRLPFDPVRDVEPVAPVASNQTVLVVPAASPYRSLADLIAAARAAPGRLNTGFLNGSTQHLANAMFVRAAGIEVLGVPYRGNATAMNDLLGGTLDYMFATLALLPQIESGRLRALGITEPRRAALLPDVPTLDEAGLTGFAATGWYGLLAPAGTPLPIIARLNDATMSALREDELRQRLLAIGSEPMFGTPQEFGAFIGSEIRRWTDVIRDAGIEQQ